MALKRCPYCGEKYSDTYRDCPFCEEEDALRDGEEIRRTSRRGRRVAHGRQYNLITPTLVVLILIMAGLLVYLLYGDRLADRGDGDKDDSKLPTMENVDDPTLPTKPEGSEDEPGGVMPEDPDTNDPGTTEQPAQSDYDVANKLPSGLTLSTTDFSLFNLGETATIRVSGGSGAYTWISEDAGIASVDSNGKVTAVSGGTVNVLVTDGTKKGVCIVRVKASGSLPQTPPTNTGDSGSGGAHTLNREDFTMPLGDTFQLKLSGVTTALTWKSANTNVATVASDGTVKGVGRGNTTVTVTWDGGSASCIVRVS